MGLAPSSSAAGFAVPADVGEDGESLSSSFSDGSFSDGSGLAAAESVGGGAPLLPSGASFLPLSSSPSLSLALPPLSLSLSLLAAAAADGGSGYSTKHSGV